MTKAPDWFQPLFRYRDGNIICEGDAWDKDGNVVGFQLAQRATSTYEGNKTVLTQLRADSWKAVWLIAQNRSPFERVTLPAEPAAVTATKASGHYCDKHEISFISACALCSIDEVNDALVKMGESPV